MLADFCAIVEEWAGRKGSSDLPGRFVIERAFEDE
jgi:hypothetical protein